MDPRVKPEGDGWGVEELWGFFVVTEKGGNEKFPWDWTPKHTRLRYQLVITALLFASFCRFEATSFKLPLSIADFSARPAQWEFVLGVFLFYLFTLASFYYRSSNERNLLDNSESEFLKSTKEMSSKLDALFDFMSPSSNESYNTLLKAIDKSKEETASALTQLRDADSLAESAVKDIESICEKLKPILKLSHEIAQLNRNHNEFAGMGDPERYKKQILSNAAKLPYEITPDNILDRLRLVSSDVGTSRGFSDNYEVFEKNYKEIFEKAVSKAKKYALEERKSFSGLEQQLTQANGVKFENLRIAIARLNSDAEKRHNYKKFDREWLGYWLPVIASGIFIFIGFWFIAGPNNTLSS